MCVIIDKNAIADVLAARQPDYAFLLNAVLEGIIRVALGGRYVEELAESPNLLLLVRQLSSAGKTRTWPDAVVKAREAEFASHPDVRSDDPHVLGLAEVSGVRLLCTSDGDLMKDFKDPSLLQPRGKVYTHTRNGTHGRLLALHRRLISGCCRYQRCAICRRD